MIGAGGLFAPTIRYHQGTFYIVCTNVGEEGDDFNAENFYISTTDIWKGDWSQPKPLEFRGIDPSLFIDDDGHAYIQGAWRLDRTEQPYSTIKQYEIDLQTGQRLSDIKVLWSGSAQIYTEGPHIYKKDGFYYLLVAEGGTFEHHMLCIARSRSLWGPFEDCPQNPVLTAYGKPDEAVQDAGHGELFQDQCGLWWATVLGVRKKDGRHPLGRETFLAPVDWPSGEWPHIHSPQLRFERQVSQPAEWACAMPHPRVDDCFIRSPRQENYRFSDRTISLALDSNDLAVPIGTASFIGKRQRADESRATATLNLSAQNIDQPFMAGLAVYKDDFRSTSMALDFANNAIMLRQRRATIDGLAEDRVLASVDVSLRPGDSIQFSIRSARDSYEFRYCLGPFEQDFVLGRVDTRDLTGLDFTGTIFGVFAHCSRPKGKEARNNTWISFDDFAVVASP